MSLIQVIEEETKVCPRCKRELPIEEFKPRMKRGKLVRRSYCRSCINDYSRGRRAKPILTKSCTICGQQFETSKSWKITCSRICSRKNKHKHKRAKDPNAKRGRPFKPKVITEPMLRVCTICFSTFETNYSQQRTCLNSECQYQHGLNQRRDKRELKRRERIESGEKIIETRGRKSKIEVILNSDELKALREKNIEGLKKDLDWLLSLEGIPCIGCNDLVIHNNCNPNECQKMERYVMKDVIRND